MLSATLQPSSLRASMALVAPKTNRLRIDLGPIGVCPDRPDLTIFDFDDSGSVTAPGGTDPVGNRYEEVRVALERLRGCDCGRCAAAVLHFDTPLGDIQPGKLKHREFQRRLAAGLHIPAGGGGSSYLEPSLTVAERFAAAHPEHEARFVALTDWALFDAFDIGARLEQFPGDVFAIGLGSAPPVRPDSETVRGVTISHSDPPGTVARALFGTLIRNRK